MPAIGFPASKSLIFVCYINILDNGRHSAPRRPWKTEFVKQQAPNKGYISPRQLTRSCYPLELGTIGIPAQQGLERAFGMLLLRMKEKLNA